MPYNSNNHEIVVANVMALYQEWKAKNGDIPDTRFVKTLLRQSGYIMHYNTFINGYKNRKNKNENANKKQLTLFG